MTSFLSNLSSSSSIPGGLSNVKRISKNPEQLVKYTLEALDVLSKAAKWEADSSNSKEPAPFHTKTIESASNLLGECLVNLKILLYGDISSNRQHNIDHFDESAYSEACETIQREDLMSQLIQKLDIVPFEARKDAALIFNNLLRKHDGFEDYVIKNVSIIDYLVKAYLIADCALTCGTMLRECIRRDSLVRYILNTRSIRKVDDQSDDAEGGQELLLLFFDEFVHLPNFEVASDAFNTLKDILTTPKNKLISADFLESHYDIVFKKYELLLLSDNYVTKRRSLKLLSDLLLERNNYSVMMKYISFKRNLVTIMTLLRHKSANIQLETFQIFKIFVANPNKTEEIISILYNNKKKLIAYLEGFHKDETDPQFVDEKRLLIDTLTSLQTAQ